MFGFKKRKKKKEKDDIDYHKKTEDLKDEISRIQGLDELEEFIDENKTQALDENLVYSEIITYGVSDIGTRDYQQDAYYVTAPTSQDIDMPSRSYGVVCDGMGGLSDGEKASQMAVEYFKKGLEQINLFQETPVLFQEMLKQLDDEIFVQLAHEIKGKAGTTLVAGIIEGNLLRWVSVGDSRIFLIRGDEILPVVREHNYRLILEEQVKQGIISKAAIEGNPKKDALISYLGLGNIKLIDINKDGFPLIDKDVVVLCSDGLTKILSQEDIKNTVKSSITDMEEAGKKLLLEARNGRGKNQDNTTVVLMQYRE
ncbi:MAG: protein phosphatase 2C domain-containing protein [Lachnospiraceae bacterium]|jgi:protein phosphatase|nr:protein phosphatase 2C domain-containing protein [Lachnospiraceae bacterium]